MPLNSIILSKGEVLLQQVAATTIQLTGYSNLQFGNISLVNQLLDNYQVGQKVLYDPEGSTSLIFESVGYNLVSVDKIKLIAP